MLTNRALDYYKKGFIWLGAQLAFFLLASLVLYFINPKSLQEFGLGVFFMSYLGFCIQWRTHRFKFPGPPDELMSFSMACTDFGLSAQLFILGVLFQKHLASYFQMSLHEFRFTLAPTFLFYVLGELTFLAYARMRGYKSEMVGSYVPPVKKEPEADQDFRFDE